MSRLCRRAPYVLLLTATPHNGDEEAFASLCDLGRLDDGLVVFRRSRLEAGRDAGRRVHTLRVRVTDAERRMHAALRSLTHAVRRESADLDRNTWLILSLEQGLANVWRRFLPSTGARRSKSSVTLMT